MSLHRHAPGELRSNVPSGQKTEDQMVHIRASFDIGSGSTKIQVAQVENGAITQTLFSTERPVAFGMDCVQSADGSLSDAIQEKGIAIFQELMKEACALGAEKFVAVATEVFRKAKNGKDYLEKIEALGITVILVTQELEAELGFRSVVAVSGEDPAKALVWDSGGASFQITHLDTTTKPPSLQKYMGALGTSISAGTLIKEVRKQSAVDYSTVNPVSKEEASQLVSALQAKMSAEIPPWLDGSEVLASAGINSLFKLCCEVLTVHARTTENRPDAPYLEEFDLSQAERAMAICEGASDAELEPFQRFPNAEGTHVVMPKLALLVAVMRHARIRRVRNVLCVGSCAGVLISPELWTR